MTDERDANGELLPDEARLTKVGTFVRSTSIDELPQLINVLKGDMALIGPRPLLVQYLPLYSKEQMRRHEVRPGISGWAQCHGRNQISWTEKFKLDVWYVDNISLMTDLKVIFITIKKVLFREDINSDNDATMGDFDTCRDTEHFLFAEFPSRTLFRIIDLHAVSSFLQRCD